VLTQHGAGRQCSNHFNNVLQLNSYRQHRCLCDSTPAAPYQQLCPPPCISCALAGPGGPPGGDGYGTACHSFPPTGWRLPPHLLLSVVLKLIACVLAAGVVQV
jgi:hypothetical protein